MKGAGGRGAVVWTANKLYDVDPTHEQVLTKVLKPKMVTCNENGRKEERGRETVFIFHLMSGGWGFRVYPKNSDVRCEREQKTGRVVAG